MKLGGYLLIKFLALIFVLAYLLQCWIVFKEAGGYPILWFEILICSFLGVWVTWSILKELKNRIE